MRSSLVGSVWDHSVEHHAVGHGDEEVDREGQVDAFAGTEQPDHKHANSKRTSTASAAIIGACCGSTPAHLDAMATALHTMPELDPREIALATPVAERQPADVTGRSRGERRARRA